MLRDPWIIPGYGCCSMNMRGLPCKGDPTNTINKTIYCNKCKALYLDSKQRGEK